MENGQPNPTQERLQPRLAATAAAQEASAAEPVPTDRLALRLRGFGPLGILAMLAIPFAGTAWISAILVLVWARLSRTSLREIGYVRPKNWIADAAIGIALGVALKLLMKALVMPLLGAGPTNQAYQFLVGNRAAALSMVLFIFVGAGFGEETVYRGFLFERFGKLFGSGLGARALTVLITSLWFGAVHYPEQGIFGVEQAIIMGLVFGTLYAATRSLFLPMVTHVAFDLAAVAIIYWNLESRVAHFIFK